MTQCILGVEVSSGISPRSVLGLVIIIWIRAVQLVAHGSVCSSWAPTQLLLPKSLQLKQQPGSWDSLSYLQLALYACNLGNWTRWYNTVYGARKAVRENLQGAENKMVHCMCSVAGKWEHPRMHVVQCEIACTCLGHVIGEQSIVCSSTAPIVCGLH